MLVDYGTEWEEAWNDHVKAWKPDKNYVSPHVLNTNHDIPLLTHDESARIYTNIDCYHIDDENEEFEIHRIRARRPDPNNQDGFVYEIEVIGSEDQMKLVKDVPRSQMSFFHKPYKADNFREGSFRHEMMIPDEMFPSAWRNL